MNLNLDNMCCDIYMETNVCYNCGHVSGEQEYSNYIFEQVPEISSNKPSKTSKISKMQNWLMWSDNEKKEYKIKMYTTDFCKLLDINPIITVYSIDFVLQIMNSIKDNYNGSKRSRVKNSIVLMCIFYISKNNDGQYNYTEMVKKFNKTITNPLYLITTKYISKANKIILDIVNNSNFKISNDLKNTILSIDKPIDYLHKLIKKYNLIISDNILNQTIELLDICNDNDLINDSTLLSISAGCFYYILEINNISIDLNALSDIYNISTATITKIYKRLYEYDSKLKNLLKI
jgi:hypothetical protein